jgi:hypothetical protein
MPHFLEVLVPKTWACSSLGGGWWEGGNLAVHAFLPPCDLRPCLFACCLQPVPSAALFAVTVPATTRVATSRCHVAFPATPCLRCLLLPAGVTRRVDVLLCRAVPGHSYAFAVCAEFCTLCLSACTCGCLLTC